MAKRTIGFEGYKESEFEEYMGEDPRPGMWLDGEVVRGKYLADDDQMVFYISVINHPDYTGWTRGMYCPLDPESTRFWVTQEMIKAIQGGQTKAVTLDWENETAVANWLKKASKVRLQTEEYGDRIRIRKVRALMTAVGAPGTKASTPTKTAPAPAAEPESDDPIEDYTQAELEEMSAEDLEEILTEEFEFGDDDLPKKPARDRTGSKYKAALIEAILAEQDGEDSDEDGDPNEDAAEEEGDEEFEDGFDDGEEEPEPEPEPAPRTRRGRAATKAAAPAPEPAPAATTRRRRR